MAGDRTSVPSEVEVRAFLEGVMPERRRAEGLELLTLFRETTGYEARMWGPTIVGFGRYAYTYASGRSGTSMATGFSPRTSAISVYIMPGYADHGPILDRLGPHRMGKSCLYITRLAAVDRAVLAELVQAGLRNLDAIWPVTAE